MICHRFRTIFIHVPKTAGISVEMVFLQKMGLTWDTRGPMLLRENIDPRLGPERLSHLYASEYVLLGHIAKVDFYDYFKFGIVRNPWARIVSEYKFNVAHTGVSFADFLLKDFPPPGLSDRRRHVEPQWKFLCDAQRKIIVNRVIRFENLLQEVGDVFRRIFNEQIALPHDNSSKDKRDYRAFYNDKTFAFVESFYRDDIEMFGYSFE